jgi:hypothetical protein
MTAGFIILERDRPRTAAFVLGRSSLIPNEPQICRAAFSVTRA